MLYLSIISVNYNNPELLINCVEKTYAELKKIKEIDFEFIIVDNYSTDNSLKILKEFEEKRMNLKLITSKKNGGFGYGCNLGAKYAKNENLWMLNSDAWVINFEQIKDLKLALSDKEIGLIGTSVLLNNGEPTPQGGGDYSFRYLLLSSLRAGFIYRSLPNIIKNLIKKFIKNKNNYINSMHHNNKVKPYYSEAIGGCSFIVKKSVFEKLEGFDEKFFLYDEDGDLSRRSINTGYKNIIFPTIIVKTINSSTTRKLPSIKLKLIKRKSRLRLIYKHYTFFKKYLLILLTELTWIFL